MPRYRVTAGHRVEIAATGETYAAGEEFAVEEAVADQLPPAVERVAPGDADSDGTDAADDAADGEGFDAEAFVTRRPMEQVITDIESGEYAAHLDAIREAAFANYNREGVHDALDAAQEE